MCLLVYFYCCVRRPKTTDDSSSTINSTSNSRMKPSFAAVGLYAISRVLGVSIQEANLVSKRCVHRERSKQAVFHEVLESRDQ